MLGGLHLLHQLGSIKSRQEGRKRGGVKQSYRDHIWKPPLPHYRILNTLSMVDMGHIEIICLLVWISYSVYEKILFDYRLFDTSKLLDIFKFRLLAQFFILRALREYTQDLCLPILSQALEESFGSSWSFEYF